MVQYMHPSDPLHQTGVGEVKMKPLARDASLGAESDESRKENDAPDSAVLAELLAPRDVVQEVAASLRSLAKVLPYTEYASIVHRIAHLRWRWGAGIQGNATPARPTTDEAYAAHG